jgi:predicted deacylase
MLRVLVLLLLSIAPSGCISDPGWSPATAEPAAPHWQHPAAANRSGPWHTSAFSQGGRPIKIRRVGHGPQRVLWIGGIHGTEPEGAVATDRLPDAIRATNGLLDKVTVLLIRDLNPDGRVNHTRTNVRGVDLNRNFPARNFSPSPKTGPRPLSEPESRFLHDLVREFSPQLVFVAHSTKNGRYINYDGPCRKLALALAKPSRYRVIPSTRIHATPGSLGSWLGVDRGIPILTVEWSRGMDQEVAWRETREGILAVLSKF